MTAREFIDLTIQRLSGGDFTPDQMAKFHPEVVRRHISSAFNQIIYDVFRKNPDELDLYAKRYDDITPTVDAVTSEYTCDLTKPVIQMPNNLGIRLVTAGDDINDIYYPISSQSAAIFDGLPVNTLDTSITYYLQGEKLFFRNMEAADAAKKVIIKQVIPFAELADTDFVYIPAGQDEKIMAVILNLFNGLPQEDLINDNING